MTVVLWTFIATFAYIMGGWFTVRVVARQDERDGFAIGDGDNWYLGIVVFAWPLFLLMAVLGHIGRDALNKSRTRGPDWKRIYKEIDEERRKRET